MLPAANWKGAGKPAGAKGYSYRLKGDPWTVAMKAGSWQATCAGEPVAFTLDEPA